MQSITIVFCVIEESKTLDACLDSLSLALANVNENINEFELVIVHNGNKFEFELFQSRYLKKLKKMKIRIKIVGSMEFNLSIARNTALTTSTSEWVLFLDDDCILDKQILNQLKLTVLECERESIYLAGGRVLLEGAEGLTDFHQEWLSKLDLGDPSRLIKNQYVNGANFLVNRKMALQFGGFDPNLGRQRDLLISGEETDLINRISKRYPGIYYNHDQIITQIIPINRRDRTFLAKRIAWEAVTRALILQKDSLLSGELRGWQTPSDKDLDRMLQTFTQLLTFGQTKKRNSWSSFTGNFLKILQRTKQFFD